MSLQEFVGAVSMEVDGREIEITSFKPKTTTGRKPVKTMNRAMRLKGFSRGITMYELSASAVVPLSGTPIDWAAIEGAKITVQPVSGNGSRYSYLDCFSIDVGEQYQVEGEATIDISMIALRKVQE
jgi:hypothetical protein